MVHAYSQIHETAGRPEKDFLKVIETNLYDDTETLFLVRIEYLTTRWMFRTQIDKFDYFVCPDAKFGCVDTLKEIIRQVIRDFEGGKIEFEC